MYGYSKTKTEARAIYNQYHLDVFNSIANISTITKTIDWGGQKRGQGKRGGVSATLYKENYSGIDFSIYPELIEEKRVKLNVQQVGGYIHARQFGFNHLEAVVYAILKYKV